MRRVMIRSGSWSCSSATSPRACAHSPDIRPARCRVSAEEERHLFCSTRDVDVVSQRNSEGVRCPPTFVPTRWQPSHTPPATAGHHSSDEAYADPDPNRPQRGTVITKSEEHTSELQSREK